MAPTSLLSIVSLALLSLFASSLTSPVNAVSIQSDHVVRRHADIAQSKRSKTKKKRSNSKRCQAKSSSAALTPSATPTSSSTKAKPTSTKAASTPTTPAAAPAKTTQAAAPAKTTQASSGSSSSSSGGLNLRGKACLAWPNYSYNQLSTWKGSNTGLIYSWDATKVPGAEELGFTYAPMLWGWKDVGGWLDTVVEGYATVALGCNEPNEQGQSNMDAQSGIDLWKQYMLPLADKGYTLISPAMSSRPNGKDWMQTFMADCGDCKVSGIATHWYGTDLEEFKTYVSYWHDTYNLPVYITEYADQDFNGGPQATMDEIWAFMTGATSWLDSQDWVHAHCWFGAMEGMDNVNPLNKLMNDDGTGPNDLGSYFINN